MCDLTGKRWCYLVLPTQVNKEGEYRALIAVEGRPGYYTTDISWGSDYEAADKAAASKNAKLGISELEAWRIIDSTMRSANSLTGIGV